MSRSLPVVDSDRMPRAGGEQSAECNRPPQGGCGFAAGQSVRNDPGSKPEAIHTEVPFKRRRLSLGATPDVGMFPTTMDLDLTVACNLRCVYCFKEKWDEHMEEAVAFDAIVWLLYASGPNKSLVVNFMGGEPLIQFRLIKRIVPFGKRRAWQMGKSLHFGVTTNGTLVTDEVVEFWKKWAMGFHTSIDGTPEIQDRNRPTASGQGSARLVERAVPKILSYRSNTMARSTVVPESAGMLVESYRYFRSLGYTSIAFVPVDPSAWTVESLATFERSFSEVGDLVIDEFRNDRPILVKGIDEMISGIVRNHRPEGACGAGRGTVLVDVHGDIWPCHRWNKASEQAWRIGNIYEHFNELARAELNRPSQSAAMENDCGNCIANKFCGGGCPAENLEETGKVYKRHEYGCEASRIWARVGQRVHDVLHSEQNPAFLKHYYGREQAV